MDIVVETASGTFYLDVTRYHPFTGKGLRRTRGGGGTPEAQEQRKVARYPVRDPRTRRRRTRATFHPVTVSTYGQVGPAARSLFKFFEEGAKTSKEAYRRRRVGWLQDAVTHAAVHGAAAGVNSAYNVPDGQERALFSQGRVARRESQHTG
jgi:hypothetical protein